MIESAVAPVYSRESRGAARRRALLAAGLLALLVALAILAPLFAPYDPAAQPDILMRAQGPSLSHPFGTDHFSRDVLSRVIFGARISLSVALLATLISVTLGTAYGALSGYAGGIVDSMMMRLLDALLAIPRLLLVLAIVAVWRTLPVTGLILVLGLTGWFMLSRIVRGQVLALKGQEFVISAEALGATKFRILWRHLLPNLVTPVLVASALGIGQVIALEAGLSYLGIGVQQPNASWGNIIRDGADRIGTIWWTSLFPGLALVLTVMCFNILAEFTRERIAGPTDT
ncbi:MAG: ABC transporter permease [Gemmatimonadaceae bacterium]|nr:ABC transporter permease [Gemmatimonadaceae bacterium]